MLRNLRGFKKKGCTGPGRRYHVLHYVIGMLIAYIVIYSLSGTKNLPVLAPGRSPASGLWFWQVSPPAALGTLTDSESHGLLFLTTLAD